MTTLADPEELAAAALVHARIADELADAVGYERIALNAGEARRRVVDHKSVDVGRAACVGVLSYRCRFGHRTGYRRSCARQCGAQDAD